LLAVELLSQPCERALPGWADASDRHVQGGRDFLVRRARIGCQQSKERLVGCPEARERSPQRIVAFGDDGPEHESPEPPPGHALLIAERNDALRGAFSRLRAADQALLRLLTADPRPPYEEIAAALDMPIGSIGPTRQRALARLREQLDGGQTLNLMID